MQLQARVKFLYYHGYIKADNEIRKIENKQISKNTKEETDWIRVSLSYILSHPGLNVTIFRALEMI